MARLFFIILILCFISITISFNFDGRFIDDETSEEVTSNTADDAVSSSTTDQCVPVYAIKELGCILSKRNILFQGIFQTVCEQHQLCYACGFAHGLTARICNKMALMNMYNLCSQNQTLPFSDCLKQRYSAITLLRHQTYRSASGSPGFFFECHQPCVFNYLNTK